MNGNFRPITITDQIEQNEQGCKSKTVIVVNSDYYNNDENYKNRINNLLKRIL